MNNKIKVCHLTTVHYVFDTRIFHKECRSLYQNGFDVTLVAQHGQNESAYGIKIKAMPFAKNRFFRILSGIQLTQKAIKEEADIYHFHDPELIPCCLMLKIITRKPVISDVHENYYESILYTDWIHKKLRKIVAILFAQFQKIVLRLFDAVVVVNDSVGAKIKNANVVIVRNFNNIEEDLKKINFVQKLPDARKFRLIFIGGIDKVRGIKEVVQAMEYFSDDEIEFVMVGSYCNPKFEGELHSLEGYKKVKYFGYTSREGVLKEMAMSDAAVAMANIKLDGLPNKLAEYMTVGLPILTCENASWSKLVKEHNCGIVVKSMKPEDIASSIRYLIDHPVVMKEMGESGQKAVAEKYNWKTEEQKLISLYQKILKVKQN